MKKIVLFLAASAMIVSCKKLADNEYEIAGTVDPALNGKNIILEKQGGYMGFTPVDTAVVKDGKFEFKGTVTEPSIHFLTIDEPTKKVDFILENGSIEIEVDKDSVHKSKRSGTHNNDKLAEYYTDLNKIRQKAMNFQKANQAAMMEAYQKQDTAAMNKLNKQYEVIGKEMKQQNTSFITKNPDTYIAVLLLKQMASSGSEPIEDIKKHYNSLSSEMKKTKEGKEIAEAIEKAEGQKANEGKVAVGNMAPGFSAPSPDGKTISLKESMGKVTIIDFWASWCKPCRIENPNVVAMYNELHNKGLNIIGVSLDKEEGPWKEAIAADKLTWNHVSNLKFWDEPIAAQYGVKSIPATFILDQSGKIVAKDLRGDELKAKVKELLGVK